jgi:hypothetical protein
MPSKKQELIDQQRAEARTPQAEAYVNELQDKHDRTRMLLGLGAEDPALQDIVGGVGGTAVVGHIHPSGNVELGPKVPTEPIGGYDKGSRS